MKISEYKTEELAKIFNDGLKAGKSGVVICKEVNLARSSVLTRLKREGYVYNKELNQYVVEGEVAKVAIEEKPKKKSVKKKADKVKEVKKAKGKKLVELKEDSQSEVVEVAKTLNKINDAKELKEEKKMIEEIEVVEDIKETVVDVEEDNIDEKATIDPAEFEVEKALSKLRESLWNKTKEKETVGEEETKKDIVNQEINVEVIKENVANPENTSEVSDIRDLLMKLEERISVLENGEAKNESVITIKNTKETTTRSIRLYKEVNDKFNKYLKKHKEKKVIDILSLAILEYINKK
ncbi:MAG: hypothetical protein ACRDDY_15280 [Clostridium sp.]|uniref:hypothetical protein n=1 Tax=Clostridium sp. TaxID=1506 RepID=UPI003EE77331